MKHLKLHTQRVHRPCFFFLVCATQLHSLQSPHQGLNPGLPTGRAQSSNLTTGLPGGSESALSDHSLPHFLYQRNSGFSLEAVTGVWRGGLLALWPQKAEWSGSSWWVLKHKKHPHCLLPSGLWAGVAMFLPGCKNQIGLCSTQVQLWHQTVPAFHPPRKLQPHLIERVR